LPTETLYSEAGSIGQRIPHNYVDVGTYHTTRYTLENALNADSFFEIRKIRLRARKKERSSRTSIIMCFWFSTAKRAAKTARISPSLELVGV
jgi:hypothetical protein